jgi:2-dehydro-3-deoxygalactonokinase
MTHFFSCDWGTSSFRLRLIDTADMSVKSEIKNHQGILVVHKLWKQSKNEDRMSFYLNFIRQQIRKIELKSGNQHNIPVIISGMASSSFGMVELPYKQLPFLTDGTDLEKYPVQSNSEFPFDCLIISGVRTDNDVMRGEETMLAGTAPSSGEEIFIFPGTHSKHVRVEGDHAVDLRTYMTGEFFELLSKKSILSASVEAGGDLGSDDKLQSFVEAVQVGLKENILHASFLTRTNSLFSKKTKQQNYHYLSGLLIAAELKDMLDAPVSQIHIVCGKELKQHYEQAAKIIGSLKTILFSSADEALIRGQFKIFSQL